MVMIVLRGMTTVMLFTTTVPPESTSAGLFNVKLWILPMISKPVPPDAFSLGAVDLASEWLQSFSIARLALGSRQSESLTERRHSSGTGQRNRGGAPDIKPTSGCGRRLAPIRRAKHVGLRPDALESVFGAEKLRGDLC